MPITLQTLGVMLAGALLGARKGVLSVLTVIVLGLALPVLAGGRTTLTSLAGPTVGFLIGWVPAVAVIGWLSMKMLPRYRTLPGVAVNVLGGIVVLYAFGIAGMVLRTDLTVWAAAAANVTFLPGDLAKAVVAAAVAAQVHRAYPALAAPRIVPAPLRIPRTDAAARPSMSEIRFREVRHAYGDRTVLDGVDVVLTERRVGIVGANGSGKSTMARMINGLLVPSSGSVTVDGLDTARKAGRSARRSDSSSPTRTIRSSCRRSPRTSPSRSDAADSARRNARPGYGRSSPISGSRGITTTPATCSRAVRSSCSRSPRSW